MPLFDALSQLITLALEELPEIEPGQQFILEPITDWGIALYTGDFLVEIVEYLGKPIIACGGVYYVPLHPFHDCPCERCLQLHAITTKRLVTMQKAG